MKIETFNPVAARFFFEQAGYVVGWRLAGAVELARAERWAEDAGLIVTWEPEPSPDFSWLPEDDKGNHQVYLASIVRYERCPCCGISQAICVASCGNIFDPGGSYVRVMEAQLALEAWQYYERYALEGDATPARQFWGPAIMPHFGKYGVAAQQTKYAGRH